MKHNQAAIVAVLLLMAAVGQGADVEWTRFTGTVKAVNLKASNVTIQNAQGDLFTIPVDYQVVVIIGKGKKGVTKILKDVTLDDDITLIRTPADKPKEDSSEGLVPYRGMP